jgi:hypothetical protein
MLALQSYGSLLVEFFLLGKSVFFLLAFNQLEETYHLMDGNLLSSKFTDFNINLI